jgi:hypothetical protein
MYSASESLAFIVRVVSERRCMVKSIGGLSLGWVLTP